MLCAVCVLGLRRLFFVLSMYEFAPLVTGALEVVPLPAAHGACSHVLRYQDAQDASEAGATLTFGVHGMDRGYGSEARRLAQ